MSIVTGSTAIFIVYFLSVVVSSVSESDTDCFFLVSSSKALLGFVRLVGSMSSLLSSNRSILV